MTEEKQTGPISEKDIPPWLQPVPDEEEGSGSPLEGKKTILITAGVAVTVVVLFVLVLLYLYGDSGDSPPRYVEADPTPIRERPAEPGGMDVPYQDKAVLDQGAQDANSAVQLAPQTEEPLTVLPEEPEASPSEIDDLVERVTREVEQTDSKPQPIAPAEPKDQGTALNRGGSQPETEPRPAQTAPVASPKQEVKPQTGPVYRVQLGAYGSEESAARAWQMIKGKYQSIVGELSPMYGAVQSGDRTLYRLRVGPLESRAAADEVCLGLRAQQQACIVVNP